VDSGASSVDPAALRHLGQKLVTLSGRLAQARGVTQSIDASQFGHQRLTDAANDFVEHWSGQADRLGGTLTDTGHRLGQAADQYDQVEQPQLHAQGQAD